MSKRPGRFGDLPVAEPRRGLPLPLVTQQMAVQLPITTMVDQTSIQTLTAPVAVTTAIGVPGPPTSQGQRPGAVIQASLTMPPAHAGPIDHTPTEISLTQHHLSAEAIDPRLVLLTDPDSDRAAAFRVLRHHLMAAGNPRIVAVSSPRAGEGKTTAAVNLAISLAECGRAKVLLVETHLRRPQLAAMFRFSPPWCFAEQLASHRHQPLLPWSLVEIPQLWLHVAAINPAGDRTQILDAPAFAIAMERLRLGGYDHIVVDTPSVLGSADINLIQDAVDAIALVAAAKKSTARDMRRTLDQLGDHKIVGAIFLQ